MYLGDTARVPYGSKSPRTVEKYSLACQRFLLDRNVKEASARLAATLRESASVAADRKATEQALTTTQAAFDGLAAAERDVPAALKPLAKQRDFLVGEVVRLQDLVLAGKAGLVDQLDSAPRRLDTIDRQLRARIGNRPDLVAAQGVLTAALKSLDDRLFELEKARAHAESERSAADAGLQRFVARRSAVDDELLDAGRRLASLDLSVDTISATVGGKEAYRARLTGPFDELERLDADIESVHSSVARLATARAAAREAYSC